MLKQVLVIHGADSFRTYEDYLENLKNLRIDFEKIKSRKGDWKDSLGEELGEDREVILPSMPNKFNAKYAEWKIWFEKLISYLEPKILLVGHSMGGAFSAKYLAENDFAKKITATFLVAAPYNDDGLENTKETIGDFAPPDNLEKFRRQGGKIHIYHSKDDKIVPFSNVEEFTRRLPDAKFFEFSDRGHFTQEKFAELVRDIKAQF